jgi:hypothetical protein
MLASSLKSAGMEVLGVCVSMGITVAGKPSKDVQREIAAGAHDEILKE